MILIWGLLEDATTRSVYDWLQRWGAPVVFVNHAAIDETAVRFASSPAPAYELQCEDLVVPLEAVRAAYLRPYDFRDYGRGTNRSPMVRNELAHHLMNGWADHAPGRIINRPSAEATNHSKLHQAARIRECGFLTPASLVTNDREEIARFTGTWGRVIYKSMSSVRSVVRSLESEDLERAGHSLGPVLFQQQIAGRNLRVHVVGDETIACDIEADEVDYRYAHAAITPFELPDAIARRAVELSRRLGLFLAGIDFIVTPADEWYCLEVNPNPAFDCFDLSDERLIARSVAEALRAGS